MGNQEQIDLRRNLIFLNLGLGWRNKFIVIKTREESTERHYFIIGDMAKYPQHVHLHYQVKLEGEINETGGGLLDIVKTANGNVIGRIWGKSNVYDGYNKSELETIADQIKTNLGLDGLKIEESRPYSLS